MDLMLLSRFPGAVPAFLGPGVTQLTWVEDAALPLGGAPFVAAERTGLERLGYTLRRVRVGTLDADAFRDVLRTSQAVYLASGLADALLAALRDTGNDQVLCEAARHGLPVVGASAGSAVLGTSIEPVLLMDGPTSGVHLDSPRGLGLVDTMVVPHADGQLPPYPPQLVEEVRARFGEGPHVSYLADDQALLVHDDHHEVVASRATGPTGA